MSLMLNRLDFRPKIIVSGVLLGLALALSASWVDHTVDYHIDARDEKQDAKEEARNESRDGGTSTYQDKDDPSKDEVYSNGGVVA